MKWTKLNIFFFFIVNWGNKGVAKVLRKKECHGLSDIVKTIRMGSGNEKKTMLCACIRKFLCIWTYSILIISVVMSIRNGIVWKRDRQQVANACERIFVNFVLNFICTHHVTEVNCHAVGFTNWRHFWWFAKRHSDTERITFRYWWDFYNAETLWQYHTLASAKC